MKIIAVVLAIACFIVFIFSLMNISRREDEYSEQYYIRKIKENESRK